MIFPISQIHLFTKSKFIKSGKEALCKFILEKPKSLSLNNTDKSLGAAAVDKSNLMDKCHRKLYDTITHQKLFKEVNIEHIKKTIFYIVWNCLKNSLVGRPINAGYSWIFTFASILVGHFEKNYIVNSTLFFEKVSI